ncbi:MAG: hypothetical protein AAF937_12600 [Planctomycetota bacterium]
MRIAVLCLLSSLSVGCSSGARIATANDGLRLERESQRERIESLEAENAELRAKLAEANARAESPLPGDVLAALPRVAHIELTRFCSIEDGEVTWVIKPTDGRGRFVQVVGTLEVRAVTSEDDPRVLAEAVLSPTEVRDAFASGIAGTGYRVMRPFDAASDSPITLTVSLHDHVTGTAHEAARVVEPR